MRRRAFAGAARKVMDVVEKAGLSPAGLLDKASRWKGGDEARLVGEALAYGDSERRRIDVWAPAGEPPADGWPVLVFFYGGGWVSGSRADYGFVGRAFAAQGFLTVLPDYGLHPHATYPDYLEDSAAAVRWAFDHAGQYGGDPQRIALSGHSAGAYNAAMIMLDPRYLFDVGLPLATIKAATLLSGPYDFPYLIERGGLIAFEKAPIVEIQPVSHTRRDAPPTLLITGTADTTVRARNSQSLARALGEAGAIVELKLYRGQSHTDPLRALSPLFRSANPALTDAALRRAARVGDGWMHAGMGDGSDLGAHLRRLAELRAEEGRSGEPFEVHVISMDGYSVDGVKRLEDLGVTDVIVGFRDPYTMPDGPLQPKIDALRQFADTVIAATR